jgi:hypothetical protein
MNSDEYQDKKKLQRNLRYASSEVLEHGVFGMALPNLLS